MNSYHVSTATRKGSWRKSKGVKQSNEEIQGSQHGHLSTPINQEVKNWNRAIVIQDNNNEMNTLALLSRDPWVWRVLNNTGISFTVVIIGMIHYNKWRQNKNQ